MTLAEKVADFMNRHDHFCRRNQIKLIRVSPGFAEAELTVDDFSLNGGGVVQGGAILTLADFCFAGAANAENRQCVTQSVNLNFVRPGTPPVLYAVAKEVSRGKRTALYRVEIFNAAHELVAYATCNGVYTGKALIPEEE